MHFATDVQKPALHFAVGERCYRPGDSPVPDTSKNLPFAKLTPRMGWTAPSGGLVAEAADLLKDWYMKMLTVGLLVLGFANATMAIDKAELDYRIRMLTAKFDAMQAKPDK